MDYNPYIRFRNRELTLSDFLAIDRTVLANERTLLSYGRTAIALLVVGGSCIKLFDAWWIRVTGFVFLALSAVVLVWGWLRFRRMQRFLAVALEERVGISQHPLTEAVRATAEEAADTTESPPPPP